jgi:hypothetical protein
MCLPVGARIILACAAPVSSTYGRNFWVGREPNHPNRRAAIRSILIDFRCSSGLFNMVCAKLFRTSITRTAAKLCAICDADHLQNSSAKRIRANDTAATKTLVSSYVF